MRLDVIGRVRLLADDGREIAVARGKMTVLLLVLAGSRGKMVSLSRLVQALWGYEPPRTSTASLHNYVSSLRSVLADASPGGQHRLQLVTDGYQLDLEPHECDLIEFEQLAAAGQAEIRRGDLQEAVRLLRSALQLWPKNGSVGGDLATSSVLVDEMVQRWARIAVAVREDCLAAEIQLGRHADVLLELRELVIENPLREQLYVLLMRALWMSGERAEALQVYHTARRKLVDELGLEPGPELAAMQAGLLGGEPPQPPVDPRAAETPRQLPLAIADFTGRESLVDRVIELLGDTGSVPTVCVSGQPGVGKTALVVHIGHLMAGQFPDGQLYVSLAGPEGHSRSPGDVLAEMLLALGVPDSAIPEGVEQRAAAYRSRLARRRVLVVLDDAVDEEQVRPLLPGTGGSAVLMTCRRRLSRLPGATGIQLAPLTEGEALTLLTTILGTERLESQWPSAVRLVDLCGRLPLALRVVAARLATRPQWSLASLAARMSVRHQVLDELSIGEFDVRAGLAVSYLDLGQLEQVAFRRFALAGTCTLALWAIAALAGDTESQGSTDRVIHQLVSSHLIEPVTGRHESYSMHDLVRAFAFEQVGWSDGAVADPGSAAHAAFHRLSDTMCALIRLAHQHLPAPPGWLTPRHSEPRMQLPDEVADLVRRDPMSWLCAEIRTVLTVLPTALCLGWYQDVLEAVERLSGFLAYKHRISDAERLYAAVAATCGDDEWAEARARFGLAQSWVAAGRFDEADAALVGCCAAFEKAGDQAALMNSLVLLCFCRTRLEDLATAETLARMALHVGRSTDEPRGNVLALRQLGHVLTRRGDAAAAVVTLRRAAVLAEGLGEPGLHAVVLSSLSTALVDFGDIDQADLVCRQAIRLLDQLDQPMASAYLRVSLGRVCEIRGDHRTSHELTESALNAFDPFGAHERAVHSQHRAAVDTRALRDVTAAVALRRLADAAGHELGVFGRAWELDVTLAADRDRPGPVTATAQRT